MILKTLSAYINLGDMLGTAAATVAHKSEHTGGAVGILLGAVAGTVILIAEAAKRET